MTCKDVVPPRKPVKMSIDIETYSSVDLAKCGVYKYTESPDFEILLFAYAFEGMPTKIIDLTKMALPEATRFLLFDPEVIKFSYNAFFEIACLNKYLAKYVEPKDRWHEGICGLYKGGSDTDDSLYNRSLDVTQWRCTMVHGAYVGLPFGLDKVAKILNLDEQKDSKGKALIKYFSCPCKPTIINGKRTRNYANSDQESLEKWELYKNYCKQDVITESTLQNYLKHYPMPEKEWELWHIDIEMLLRGVKLDRKLIENILSISEQDKNENMQLLQEITRLNNPNSVTQLKAWIESKINMILNGLTKDIVSDLISELSEKLESGKLENEELKAIKDVLTVLKIRRSLGKTSVKKFDAMLNCICEDDKLRGVSQFYGANRTGRWAGRLVQVQNLPQNHLEKIEVVRDDFKTLDYETLHLLYGHELQNIISQLVRTAFIPQKNHKFIVVDFSAIEARVIAYLSGETWRLDVFKTHGKIYEASASKMFNVPIESIGKGSELRQKGKIAELALGYGGSVGALTSMGALKMGLKEDELSEIVTAWRSANTNITFFWRECEKACLNAIKYADVSRFGTDITIGMLDDSLVIYLPSGRKLCYRKAEIGINAFGNECVTYYSQSGTTKQWQKTDTFGGKIVENIVQAVSRDILAESILRITASGYRLLFHVHDEVVLEVLDVDLPFSTWQNVAEIMSREISWAKGLPLAADGYECDFYKKD